MDRLRRWRQRRWQMRCRVLLCLPQRRSDRTLEQDECSRSGQGLQLALEASHPRRPHRLHRRTPLPGCSAAGGLLQPTDRRRSGEAEKAGRRPACGGGAKRGCCGQGEHQSMQLCSGEESKNRRERAPRLDVCQQALAPAVRQRRAPAARPTCTQQCGGASEPPHNNYSERPLRGTRRSSLPLSLLTSVQGACWPGRPSWRSTVCKG